MSISIKINQNRVRLSSPLLDLPFEPPPAKLTQVVLETLAYLRRSPKFLQQATRSDIEEVERLFRDYGQALYRALLPTSVRLESALLVECEDPSLWQLPFELLHDGSSFVALTVGLVRAFQGQTPPHYARSRKILERLEVSLNAFQPLKLTPRDEKAFVQVEQLPLSVKPEVSKARFAVRGNATRGDLLEALRAEADLLLFAGDDESGGWELEGSAQHSQEANWLQPAFLDAAQNGLRVLLLNTTRLMHDPAWITHYFDFGVPVILPVTGNVGPQRYFSYFRELVLCLQKEDNLARAHRHALNHLRVETPQSWDFVFFPLYAHAGMLQSDMSNPLRSFVFQPFEYQPQSRVQNLGILAFHPFLGNPAIIQELIFYLHQAQQNKILGLVTQRGENLESYLYEFFRRHAAHDSHWSIFYYQRWGFRGHEELNLEAHHFQGKFNALFEEEQVLRFFEESVLPMRQGAERSQQYLTIYDPPNRMDPIFESWLLKKQAEGWQVILLSAGPVPLSLPVQWIEVDRTDKTLVRASLQGNFPEPWEEAMQARLPASMESLHFLHQANRSENLIQAVVQADNYAQVAAAYLEEILPQLSMVGRRLFPALLLMRIKLPLELLTELLETEDLTPYLIRQQGFGLIEGSLDQKMFWVSRPVLQEIERQHLISEDALIQTGRELLQRLSAMMEQKSPFLPYLRIGFFNLMKDLFERGFLEGLILRSLQFARKLAQQAPEQQATLFQLIRASLEMSLLSDKPGLREEGLLGTLNVLELLPHCFEKMSLYTWFLEQEHQKRNWPMVSELMTKLAKLHAERGENERALGYLTSALSLNNDIQQFGDRYNHLNAIAMLLVELGEYSKAKHLVEHANFQPSLLNEEQMTQLWLIDAHLLFAQGAYEEAQRSVTHLLQRDLESIPPGLLAKTHLIQGKMAQMHQESIRPHMLAAAELYEKAGRWQDALGCREQLVENAREREALVEEAQHLEWIFHYHKNQGNNEKASQMAHQLGGLFYRIQNPEKSTEYYRLAQGFER